MYSELSLFTKILSTIVLWLSILTAGLLCYFKIKHYLKAAAMSGNLVSFRSIFSRFSADFKNIISIDSVEGHKDASGQYITYILFHLSIGVTILISLIFPLLSNILLARGINIPLRMVLLFGLGAVAIRLYQRIDSDKKAVFSNRDDIFYLAIVGLWIFSAVILLSIQNEVAVMVFYLFGIAVFLSLPFGKFKHCLTWPVGRLYADCYLGNRSGIYLDYHKQNCLRCGLCLEACHYYQANRDIKISTPYKLFCQTTKDLSVDEMRDISYGACSLCGRCSINCPMGIDAASLHRHTRGILTRQNNAPQQIVKACNFQRQKGNHLGISSQEYFETIDWLEQELKDDLGNDKLKIPLDKQNAEVLLTIHPREIKYDPRTLLAVFKLLTQAKVDWTLPSTGWDNSNFGYFSGDDQLQSSISGLVIEQAQKLQIGKIVVTECGHGYITLIREMVGASRGKLVNKVESIVETLARLVSQKNICFNPEANSFPVTYHDPCNLARFGGIVDKPRFLLKNVCRQFVEMTPNGYHAFCCSGGGGGMALPEYVDRRMEAGKIKIEQIRQTGVPVVATACFNCKDTIYDLSYLYKLDIEVKNICELVAGAMK